MTITFLGTQHCSLWFAEEEINIQTEILHRIGNLSGEQNHERMRTCIIITSHYLHTVST